MPKTELMKVHFQGFSGHKSVSICEFTMCLSVVKMGQEEHVRIGPKMRSCFFLQVWLVIQTKWKLKSESVGWSTQLLTELLKKSIRFLNKNSQNFQ